MLYPREADLYNIITQYNQPNKSPTEIKKEINQACIVASIPYTCTMFYVGDLPDGSKSIYYHMQSHDPQYDHISGLQNAAAGE